MLSQSFHLGGFGSGELVEPGIVRFEVECVFVAFPPRTTVAACMAGARVGIAMPTTLNLAGSAPLTVGDNGYDPHD